ncbi:hypothetical protein FACS1894170_10420 [Planctomycetales bacterium]|nr:hypothetical protein FACS1894170_10420 [Planctomycetales bacterium]
MRRRYVSIGFGKRLFVNERQPDKLVPLRFAVSDCPEHTSKRDGVSVRRRNGSESV